MKFLLLFLVFLALGWYWRAQRNGQVKDGRPAKPPPVAAPQDMVPCRHCGVHVPRQDAVTGARGLYCSSAHRSAQEP